MHNNLILLLFHAGRPILYAKDHYCNIVIIVFYHFNKVVKWAELLKPEFYPGVISSAPILQLTPSHVFKPYQTISRSNFKLRRFKHPEDQTMNNPITSVSNLCQTQKTRRMCQTKKCNTTSRTICT